MAKVVATAAHAFAYNGKASLVELLDRHESAYFALLDEAARMGWLSPERLQDAAQELDDLATRNGLPQAR